MCTMKFVIAWVLCVIAACVNHIMVTKVQASAAMRQCVLVEQALGATYHEAQQACATVAVSVIK